MRPVVVAVCKTAESQHWTLLHNFSKNPWSLVWVKKLMVQGLSREPVSTVTTLWAGRSGDFFCSRQEQIFCSPKTSRLTLGSAQPPIQSWRRAVHPGLKRSCHETDHSPHLALGLRMSGAVLLLPLCLHGIHKDNFNYTGTSHTSGVWCNEEIYTLLFIDRSCFILRFL